MRGKSFTVGSIVAAFAASLCCLGPLILAGLGVGATVFSPLVALRPYFVVLSAILLAAGFYFVYRKPKAVAACEGEACAPNSRAHGWAKPALWLATLAVLALAMFPTYGSKLVGQAQPRDPVAVATVATAQFKIANMDCPVCADVIQHKLVATPGVLGADVLYPAGSATVKYDARKVAPAQLVQIIDTTGFKASVAK
jgi:mercuric ion transport protein